MTSDSRAALSRLPQVDALLRHDDAAAPLASHGRRAFGDALRAELEVARERIRGGAEAPTAEHLLAAATVRLARRRAGRLARVINATGVVLHTNLGRAPLSTAARDAVAEASGYTTLEYDRAAGTRGSRTAELGVLAAELCGTEAATVVNNGAAALVLTLAALAQGREVIVSRGELIEIGGSYRLPDMMAASGSRPVEVGTTNRTRVADYRAAVGADTALLLKVHRSNYAIVGFTEEADPEDLALLASETGVPFVHDVGSGLIHTVGEGPLASEPSVDASVRAGADLVLFSGDKLLGGPQAGIIAGRRELVQRCSRHPLARAFRVDKLQRAALEATLDAHLRHDVPLDVPAVAMVHTDPEAVRDRVTALAEGLGGGARMRAVSGVIGGGSLPGVELPSFAVAVPSADADGLARTLRTGEPCIVARIEDGEVLLDLRTVPPEQDAELLERLRTARG